MKTSPLSDETAESLTDTLQIISPGLEDLETCTVSFLAGVEVVLRSTPSQLREAILEELACLRDQGLPDAQRAYDYLARRWNGPGRSAA